MLHHLLWTSGWDSTFRLLDLLIVKQQKVQPYYLLDPLRRSMYKEMEAMKYIRNATFGQYPYTQDLLLKTKFIEVSSLKSNVSISQLYQKIKKQINFGSQYEWLALFAEEYQIHLEFAAEKIPKKEDSKGYDNWVEAFVVEHLEVIPQREELIFRVKSTSQVYELVKYFEWPIATMTKLDCERYAIEHNFRNIMDYTWFCHDPIGDLPCGKCSPCRQVIRYGFSSRMPLQGKILYYLYQIKEYIIKTFKKLGT